MYFPLAFGASTVLNPKRTSAKHVMELVSEYRPSIFFSVPTLYAAILREAETTGQPLDFSPVRQCVSAGETLPAEIFERWKRTTGLEILDGIGSTEMLHIFVSSRPGKCQPGSCGVPVPGYDAKIVDDASSEVPAGEVGNFWVRGQRICGVLEDPRIDRAHQARRLGHHRRQVSARHGWLLSLLRSCGRHDESRGHVGLPCGSRECASGSPACGGSRGGRRYGCPRPDLRDGLRHLARGLRRLRETCRRNS